MHGVELEVKSNRLWLYLIGGLLRLQRRFFGLESARRKAGNPDRRGIDEYAKNRERISDRCLCSAISELPGYLFCEDFYAGSNEGKVIRLQDSPEEDLICGICE
jgi:hypothetical protein